MDDIVGDNEAVMEDIVEDNEVVMDDIVEENEYIEEADETFDSKIMFQSSVENTIKPIDVTMSSSNDPNNERQNDEESDSSSSDEDIPKSFESAIDFSDNFLDHLNNMLQCLTNELNANLARQEEIDEEITELQDGQISKSTSTKFKSQHVSVSKKALTVFGFPYFKDKNVFYPPPN